MILIQILLIFLILFIASRLIFRLKNKQIGLANFLIWLIFWICAGIVIVYPESSSYLARLFGVGRGVDLIIYISLILLFYFVFYITVRLHIIEQQITEIVRKISLKKEQENQD